MRWLPKRLAVAEPDTTDAKYDDARRRLTDELQKIADEATFLDPDRPEWEPLLDSQRVVGTVLVLEDLFPVKIPPDKVGPQGRVQRRGRGDRRHARPDQADRGREAKPSQKVRK